MSLNRVGVSQARVLQRALASRADYPAREIDTANLRVIDDEMNSRDVSASRAAAPPSGEEKHQLEELLQETAHATGELAHQFAEDSPIRTQYVDAVRGESNRIMSAFARGEISASDAAAAANKMRNDALAATRTELTPAGKALSHFLKEQGLTLEQACAKYAGKEFAKPFGQLSAAERGRVLLTVAEKAGVTNATVNVLSQHASKLNKALLAVTIAVAIYQVANAEDKVREGVKQVGGLAGAWAGGKVGAATGTFVCAITGVGVAATPACAVVGMIGGALLRAWEGERLADSAYRSATGVQ